MHNSSHKVTWYRISTKLDRSWWACSGELSWNYSHANFSKNVFLHYTNLASTKFFFSSWLRVQWRAKSFLYWRGNGIICADICQLFGQCHPDISNMGRAGFGWRQTCFYLRAIFIKKHENGPGTFFCIRIKSEKGSRIKITQNGQNWPF